MLDQVIENHDTGGRLRSILASHLDSFAAHLAGNGYAATTVRSRLTLLRHFSEWLTRHRRGPSDSDELVATFLNERKRQRRLHRGQAATLRQFLFHLRTQGVIETPALIVDDSPVGQLQRQYEQYLRTERGLAPVTVMQYGRVLRQFLIERFGNGTLDLRALDVSTIATFVIRHAQTMSPRYAQGMVTALRSIPRRSRKLTHFCSRKVTHTRNRVRKETQRTVPAEAEPTVYLFGARHRLACAKCEAFGA